MFAVRVILIPCLLLVVGCRTSSDNLVKSYGSAKFGTVIVIEVPEQAYVSATLLLSVGAAEDGDQEGMAHFAEHRAFVGALDATGYQGSINAFTTLKTTEFTSSFDQDSLPEVINFYQSVMSNYEVSQDRFERERERIFKEISVAENTPISRNEVCAARTIIFTTNPWGNCVIGRRDVIEAVQSEEIKQFQEAYYRSENTILIISGPVDATKIEELVPHIRPAIWEGVPLPTPSFEVQQQFTQLAQKGRMLVAYRIVSMPLITDDTAQSAALTFFALWDIDRLRVELDEVLQSPKFLTRNFDLLIEPLDNQNALISIVTELERDVLPIQVIQVIETAIKSIQQPSNDILHQQRSTLVREAAKPNVFHSLLLTHIRNRLEPMNLSTFIKALENLRVEEIVDIHESIFQANSWRFIGSR